MNNAWIDRLFDMGLPADAAIWSAVTHNDNWSPHPNNGDGAWQPYDRGSWHGEDQFDAWAGSDWAGDGNGCGDSSGIRGDGYGSGQFGTVAGGGFGASDFSLFRGTMGSAACVIKRG